MFRDVARLFSYLLPGEAFARLPLELASEADPQFWLALDAERADRLRDSIQSDQEFAIDPGQWHLFGLLGTQIRASLSQLPLDWIQQWNAFLMHQGQVNIWRQWLSTSRVEWSDSQENILTITGQLSPPSDTALAKFSLAKILLLSVPFGRQFYQRASPLAAEMLGLSQALLPVFSAWLDHEPDLADVLPVLMPISQASGTGMAMVLEALAQLPPQHDLPADVARQRIADLMRESERRMPSGPGPSQTPEYEHGADEPEAFTPDRAWMPELVLVAKHTLVWLHQLSARYGHAVEQLDQIPDAALSQLADWGITGLWLIGLWERSPASAALKTSRVNEPQTASAYSIFDYQIAESLGGWPALESLKEQAAAHGIRLGADMVPNHTGLDSRWIREHPDYFLWSPKPPFPAYRFSGKDLSDHPGISLYLEDHYADQSDAAVVFKRRDNTSGDVRYIYHGNDGTTTPWNDTAQLDFLNPDTRAAVVAQIVQVARTFPIIRFDAAMVLARRHVQRLWYPAPGAGGAIPSRAVQGLSTSEFDRLMPQEFWREVVEQIHEEFPDTLLLAEAFWLMEGYFVRSLGMHRVYNSAFMNMLRDEENEKFQQVLRKTMAFSPEILKRFVNFLNNPDEDSAIEQFGRDAKYLGCSVLLFTLPGVPMLGHGQIEGLSEKYGMEFSEPMLAETPDLGLVNRYERQLLPLLQWRSIFASTQHFQLLYGLDQEQRPLPEVIAYTNRDSDRQFLIIFNNQPDRCHLCLPIGSSEDLPDRTGLGQALGWAPGWPNGILAARDQVSDHEFLFGLEQLKTGQLCFELAGYQSLVLTDFNQEPVSQSLIEIAKAHAGRGIGNRPQLERQLPFRQTQTALKDWFALLSDEPAIDPELIAVKGSVLAIHGSLSAALDLKQTSAAFSPPKILQAYLKRNEIEIESAAGVRGISAARQALDSWLAAPKTTQVIWGLCALQIAKTVLAISPNQEVAEEFWTLSDWDKLFKAQGLDLNMLKNLDQVIQIGLDYSGDTRSRARRTLSAWLGGSELGIGSHAYAKLELRAVTQQAFWICTLLALDEQRLEPRQLKNYHAVMLRILLAEEVSGYARPALMRAISL
jgi:glycosidase